MSAKPSKVDNDKAKVKAKAKAKAKAKRKAKKAKAEAEAKAKAKAKIEELRGLELRDFEVWRFFEHRADEIKGSLWTTATWLVALQGALLAFTLNDQVIEFTEPGVITAKHQLVVMTLSGLGLALAALTFAIVDDIARHVRINWLRASAAKGDYDAVSRSNRISTLIPLHVVEFFFVAAFLSLFLASWTGQVADWIVLAFVLLAVVVVALYKSGFLEERPERTPNRRKNKFSEIF